MLISQFPNIAEVIQQQDPSFQTIPAIVMPYFPLFVLQTVQQSAALFRPASVPPIAAHHLTSVMPALGVELLPQGAFRYKKRNVVNEILIDCAKFIKKLKNFLKLL